MIVSQDSIERRELFKRIRQDIKEKQYAAIPFPLTKEELDKAAEYFLDFLRLPIDLKEQFYFIIDPKDRGSKVGYVRKRKKLGKRKKYADDDKELFHYHECAEDAFKELLASGTPHVTTFFASARTVYRAAKTTIKTIIQAFETEFPGVYKKFFSDKGYPRFYLRFLKYNIPKKDKTLASGHYDLGGCTLTIAESGPGLRMGTDDSDLNPVAYKEGYVLFTTGFNFQKVTSSEFHPAWHDVIKIGKPYSKDVARWSIVFFADPVGMEIPKFEQTNTPKKFQG
ncbi:hypothetical protein MYX07_03685 [Patescibacteria group bacterium AH-259-L07]|nr:hypothetical protein [Patescibacteria group bacterium AH-259-L07]